MFPSILLKINFLFSLSFYLLILAIVISIISIIIYYRRTNPDINRTNKVILFSLRLIAFILVIFSIGQTAVEILSTQIEKPRTAILIDNSKSISFEKELVKKTLIELTNNLSRSKKSFDLYIFSEKIENIDPDSLQHLSFDGSSTNINSAISEISKKVVDKNYQNLILVTDGIYNSGEKPIYAAERLNIPIHTIGVGNPLPKNDISLDEIISNDLMYAQNRSPVKLIIKQNGFNNQTVNVSFFEDQRLIARKQLTLESYFQEIDFEYIPEKEGEKKLSFFITSLGNEFTTKNNSISKYVNVLSNKIKVLTIAGKPNHDLSFVNQSIRSNKDFRLETLIEKSDGNYYPLFNNERFIDSIDAIFMIGFPAVNNSDRLIKLILTKIQRDNTPIFILINPETDFNKLVLFKQYLPFDWRSAYGTSSQIFIDIPEEKSKKEILNIDPVNSAQIWNSLPPIYRVDREFVSKAESEVLAFFRLQNFRVNQPLLISRKLNKHRSIAFLGYNIWRLKLLNAMKEEESIYLDKFINNSVKWLTTKEAESNFTVKPAKKIFDIQDKIKFTAQLYDESNNPVEDANIYLEILQKGEKKSLIQFRPLGNGLYNTEISDLQVGDYDFQSTAEYGGKKYFASGRFSIIETELEFRDLSMREELLKQISQLTQGLYFHINESNDFITKIDKILQEKPKERKISKLFYAWNSLYVLIALIVFLSSEWYLRKKFGLM